MNLTLEYKYVISFNILFGIKPVYLSLYFITFSPEHERTEFTVQQNLSCFMG